MSKIETITVERGALDSFDWHVSAMERDGWERVGKSYATELSFCQDMERLSRERPSRLVWVGLAVLAAWFAVASVIAVAVIWGVVV